MTVIQRWKARRRVRKLRALAPPPQRPFATLSRAERRRIVREKAKVFMRAAR